MRTSKTPLLLMFTLLTACHSTSETPFPTPPDHSENQCNCDQSWCYASCCIDHCVATMASIDHAQTSIRIASATPLSPDITASLQKAHARGVDIRIITAKEENTTQLRQKNLQAKTLPTLPPTPSLIVDNTLPIEKKEAPLQSFPTTASDKKIYSFSSIMPNALALKPLTAIDDWETLWQKAQ